MSETLVDSKSNSDPILQIGNVSHAYGQVLSVQDINLTVEPGELLFLLGPSGCGKSTVLRLIAGLERPSAGNISIGGEEVSSAQYSVPVEQRHTGLVFQDFALFPHFTVLENVNFGLHRLDQDVARKRAEEVLTLVGLETKSGRYPAALSGGEQQRLAVARALAPKPQLMLLDEPFSGLDQRLKDHVRDQTLAILRAEGTATVQVTHDPEEALRMADRIALMRDGRIVQIGSPADLYDNPVDLGAAAFFSELNIFHGVIENGTLSSPLGSVDAKEMKEGDLATLAFRPHSLIVGHDTSGKTNFTVEKSRHLGERGLVFLRSNLIPSPVIGYVATNQLPPKGSQVSATLSQHGHFVFPGHVTL